MRLFVALEIPPEVRESLIRAVDPLKPKCPGARWARPEGFHITLKFIGRVDQHAHPEKPEAIAGALASVASRAMRPVEVRFENLTVSPNERSPRVLWCGVQASSNLPELAAELERVLVPLGIPAESRPFVPHLTLARFGESVHCPEIVSAARELRSRTFGCARPSSFHLFESFTQPSGAEYKKLRTFSFTEESL